MRLKNLNIFFAWVLIAQTLLMDWGAFIGQKVLALMGHNLPVEAVAGRVIGFFVLCLICFVVSQFMKALPPNGNPEGKGYKAGHKLVLAANILAGFLFVFPLTFRLYLEDPNAIMILSKFAIAAGYIAVAGWAIGFARIYQSTIQEKELEGQK